VIGIATACRRSVLGSYSHFHSHGLASAGSCSFHPHPNKGYCKSSPNAQA